MSIPSTISLAKCEAISFDELRKIASNVSAFEFKSKPDDNDVEASIREMLPFLNEVPIEYPKDEFEKEKIGLRMVDFTDGYDYTTTNFG